jgi:hypothetical protein
VILPPGVRTHVILRQEKVRIAAGGLIFRIVYVYHVDLLRLVLIVVVSLEDLLVLKISLRIMVLHIGFRTAFSDLRLHNSFNFKIYKSRMTKVNRSINNTNCYSDLLSKQPSTCPLLLG